MHSSVWFVVDGWVVCCLVFSKQLNPYQ